MSDEVRLIDRFIPAMEITRYLEWQWGKFITAPGEPEQPCDTRPPCWIKLGDIHGRVWFDNIASSEHLPVREPCTLVRFGVSGLGEWCSDDPEVFALLAKLGIKPMPAKEAKP